MDSLPTGADVLVFLGWPADTAMSAQANAHVVLVTAMAREYTRGVGFGVAPNDDECEESIRAVIISAAARSLTNPSQSRRVEAGSFNSVPGVFSGWNLAEVLCLNAYRRRAG